MEIRSRVADSPTLALCMQEDSPDASIQKLPPQIDRPSTYTEVVIAPVHDVAQKAVSGRRLSDYLASELRGQILAHNARAVVIDRIARGTSQKEFLVTPRRFVGERLALAEILEIEGFAPLRVELYLARGSERPAIQVACAGTVVADDIADLAALGLNERPWTGNDLVGLLDFASFSVPPGTRRGVAPDRAAEAFVNGLERLRPLVISELERLDAQRRVAADREVVRDLQRALRGFRRHLPQYDLPVVARTDAALDAAVSPSESRVGEPLASGPSDADSEPPESALELFEPGPLAKLRIVPTEVPVAPGSERRVHAIGTDTNGARIAPNHQSFWWSIEPATAALVPRSSPPPPHRLASRPPCS
jgi:hypothetical protein